MRILVVNPNTSEEMTRDIAEQAARYARADTELETVAASWGPRSIEGHYEEHVAAVATLEAIGSRAGSFDAVVIACFGDPGLEAARELARGPVVGIAEAGMRAATYLGRSFSVVTTLGRTRGRAWDLASTYGVERACRGVHACEIPVLELETSPDAQERITRACREALALDESDVIVLGCAGMADLCAHISDAIGAPVIDGVAAAVVTVEGLVRLGLRTSGINEYATPPAKAYTGLLAEFQLGEDPAAGDLSLGSEIGAPAPHSLPSERSKR